jgi:outer membrane protein, multidrug efflux system
LPAGWRIEEDIPRGHDIFDIASPPLPEALPSDLLERRPDILAAEQSLEAANARISVAKAEYFPRISLTGLFAVESAELSNLFSGRARTWQVASSLAQPLFTAGKVRGQVEAASAREEKRCTDMC